MLLTAASKDDILLDIKNMLPPGGFSVCACSDWDNGKVAYPLLEILHKQCRIHIFEPNPVLARDASERGVIGFEAHANSLYNKNEQKAVGQNHVNRIRLDNVLSWADFVQVCVGGDEFYALDGAQGILDTSYMVWTQLHYNLISNDMPTYTAVDLLLHNHKFRLFNIYNIIKRERLIRADALYLNLRYYEV